MLKDDLVEVSKVPSCIDQNNTQPSCQTAETFDDPNTRPISAPYDKIESAFDADEVIVKIDPQIGLLRKPNFQFMGTPGETLQKFIAGKIITVETSYKAAYGFENPS